MLYALVPRVRVVTDAGTDSWHLVRGNADANPRSADEDAAVRVAGHQAVTDELGEVRVIGRFGIVGSKVVGFVPQLCNELTDPLLQLEAGVI